MKDIEDLCQRSIIINEGEIVYDGQLNKINSLFEQTKIIRLQVSKVIDQQYFEKIGIIKLYDGFNIHIEVKKNALNNIIKVLLEQLPIVDLNIGDIPIEEGIELIYTQKNENRR